MKISFCFKEKLLAKNNNYYLCYSKGCLFLKDFDYNNVKKIRIHKWYKSFTIFERLLRKEPRVAFALNNETFMFSDGGFVYSLNTNTFDIKQVHSFTKGMNNPLSFCVIYDDKGKVVSVFYGEYIWNEDKGPVSIYKYDLKEWKCVYTFPKKTITHIHNISFDKNNNKFLILTGDDDKQSAIWEADIDFLSIKKIIGGKQVYRSCVCLPTSKGIYYTTDTPLEKNHLFLLKNDNSLIDIASISGPCIYGTSKKNTLFFATSVEGDPSVGKIRYRLFNKLGKGVEDRYVHIYRYEESAGLTEIDKYKKDILPMWLFQFGNAHFVNTNNEIYFSTQSTTKKGTYKIIEE